MKINDAVARLVRAGDENSAMWRKLDEAINELGKMLATKFPGEGKTNNLPRNYQFKHWPDGNFAIAGFCKERGIGYILMRDADKERRGVLGLCTDISTGWLDEVSVLLEKENTILTRANWNIRKFTNPST